MKSQFKEPIMRFTIQSQQTEENFELVPDQIQKIEFKPTEAITTIYFKDGKELEITDIDVVMYNFLVSYADYEEIEFVVME